MAERPFPPEPGIIGHTRDGAQVALRDMTPKAAAILGPSLAAIDPWARAGYDGAKLAAFFARGEEAAPRYRILCGESLAGAMVVREPWLHGPYLNLIGLLPPFHGAGIGSLTLDWMEARARGAGNRNLWLCVSSYNDAARRLYERHGFRLTARLPDLALDATEELLMRKRLA